MHLIWPIYFFTLLRQTITEKKKYPKPLISAFVKYDVLSLNNARFGDYLQLVTQMGLKLDTHASCLDLHPKVENRGSLLTKLYDIKRNDFNFQG